MLKLGEYFKKNMTEELEGLLVNLTYLDINKSMEKNGDFFTLLYYITLLQDETENKETVTPNPFCPTPSNLITLSVGSTYLISTKSLTV